MIETIKLTIVIKQTNANDFSNIFLLYNKYLLLFWYDNIGLVIHGSKNIYKNNNTNALIYLLK